MSRARWYFLHAEVLLVPFVVSYLFHAFGAWIGCPAFVVGGLFWTGALALIRQESERSEK